MVVVIDTVLFTDAKLPLIDFEHRKVYTEAGPISEQHTLVPPRKSLQSLFSVDASDLLRV